MQYVESQVPYDDPIRPEGGFAVICLKGWAVSAGVTTTAVIYRTEKDATVYLSPEGWQPSEYAWTPEEIRAEGEDLEIVFGPDISEQIEQYDVVRIVFPELGAYTQGAWGNIAPATGRSSAPSYAGRARFSLGEDGQVQLEGKISDRGIVKPYNETFPAQGEVMGLPYRDVYNACEGEIEFDPARRVARIVSSKGRPAGADDGDVDLRLDPVAGDDPVPPTGDEAQSAPAPTPVTAADGAGGGSTLRGLVLPLGGALVVLLLLIGAFLLYRDGLPALPGLAGLFGGGEEETTASQPVDETPSASAGPGFDELHRQGVRAAEAGLRDEAVQRFRRPLAEDHVPTLLYYGEHYDSMDFSPVLVDRPNDQAALDFYKRACAAGSEAARSRVAALRTHLEERAAAGDIVADDMLYYSFPDVDAACTT